MIKKRLYPWILLSITLPILFQECAFKPASYGSIAPPAVDSNLIANQPNNDISEVLDFFQPALNGLFARNESAKNQSINSVNDLLANFWSPDAGGGHITPTWYGYTDPDTATAAGALGQIISSVNLAKSSGRGGVWDRSTLYHVLYSQHLLTGNPDLQQRLQSDWNYFRTLYSQSELSQCGSQSSANFATDDTGWNAIFFLEAYEATQDPWALRSAQLAIDCAYSHFASGDGGQSPHGLWYSDAHSGSSIYEVSLALAALQIYTLTNDINFYQKAMDSYTWIQRDLLRADGIYWTEFNISQNRPLGVDQPNAIAKGGSVTFLAGNMGMAVLNARLYRMNGDDKYRRQAVATLNGILLHERLPNGVLLDDRDAWTNGAFVVPLVREVISLPGSPTAMQDSIFATANSISTRDRLPGGFYGGDWDGFTTTWLQNGSLPQQIYTSTQAINFILAAAFLATHNDLGH